MASSTGVICPHHFNALRGSYSPTRMTGLFRINEFKQMGSNLPSGGLRVVMDVVYNHTGLSAKIQTFTAIFPGYYPPDDR